LRLSIRRKSPAESLLEMEISPKAAGEFLRLTDSRVRQLLRDGLLPGRLVGRRWVVRRSDVLSYHRDKPRKVSV
jgi:hypothetical protein